MGGGLVCLDRCSQARAESLLERATGVFQGSRKVPGVSTKRREGLLPEIQCHLQRLSREQGIALKMEQDDARSGG